eukprot:scaffold5816_cov267-Pinguiococcus_pyrenoidosus.AAC.3
MDELQALSKQSKLEKFKGGEKFGGSGFTGTSDIGGGSADGLGGEMMFVHLDTSEDQEYSKQEIDVYLRQWKELLQTGGITAQVYNIGSATTLVTVPGYQSQQAKDFLLSRPEVGGCYGKMRFGVLAAFPKISAPFRPLLFARSVGGQGAVRQPRLSQGRVVARRDRREKLMQ